MTQVLYFYPYLNPQSLRGVCPYGPEASFRNPQSKHSNFRILLGHLVHIGDGYIDLFNSLGLLVGSSGNFCDQFTDLGRAGGNLSE